MRASCFSWHPAVKKDGWETGPRLSFKQLNTPSQDEQLKVLEKFKLKSTTLKWAPSDGPLGGRGVRFQVDSSRSRGSNKDPKINVAAVVSAQPQFQCTALSRSRMGCICVPWQKTLQTWMPVCWHRAQRFPILPEKLARVVSEGLSPVQESRILFPNQPLSSQGTQNLLECPCTTFFKVSLTHEGSQNPWTHSLQD